MKKILLLTLLFVVFTIAGFSQTNKYWSASNENSASIIKDKAVGRLSFPVAFKLFKLDLEPLRRELFTVTDNNTRHSTLISLPNVEGGFEEFEVFEASNFDPVLQAQFPGIRSFSGRGITDKSAILKLSISPQGIQTMLFRVEKENEFIEAYSQDHTIYAVFKSHRTAGQLPWSCTTADNQLANGLNNQVSQRVESSAGQLKTMRLAQSVTAEYSNYFGATSAAQVGLVLAAINATLTRCNGVYEKDLALHLNLIANTTSVIYYNASTDPYANASTGAGGTWNGQLQSTLTSVIGEANYDIGHLFGASGGGGNAGCIGCVCTNGSKGSGFTSPGDAIPQGDNFDIDYVVHEVGHQLGANHTYSFQSEGTSVQKEVGSGITIMGYAGITPYDVAPHSIDIFHEASIAQIQANLATKTCPVTFSITAVNATPVVAGVSNYTIPKSTPFALTGSATDANAGDVLTYCWEQNDNATTFGSSSVASATKATGPNWISFSPTTSPVRYFPKLATILAGSLISGPLPGGDAGANTEALSSVARTLNFRLTVRDNCPYSSTAPVKVGQTGFIDMVVTVNAASGPFAVSAPNTAVSWPGNSTQTITWAVASTTAAPVSCANVKISLSTDGGQTFPTVLAASTANDGSEALVIPNTATTTARIKVEAVGNIFFDISNTNFTITASAGFSTITTGTITPTTFCAGAAVSVPFTTNGAANAGNVFTAQLSNSSGSFASPVSIGTLSSTAAGTIAGIIPAGTAVGTGYRIRVVSSSAVVIGSANTSNITVNVSPSASVITAGGPIIFCSGGNVVLSGNNNGGTWNTGSSATTLTVTAAGDYFVTNSNGCGSVQSNHITVTITASLTASVSISANPSVAVCAGTPVTLTATPVNGGNPPSYSWSVNGVNVSGGSQPGLNIVTLNFSSNSTVVCVMSMNPNAGACVAPTTVTSNSITVPVNPLPVATITPAGSIAFCSGNSAVLNASTGTGFIYQWRNGGTNIVGATTASLTVTSAGSYDVIITNSSSCKDTAAAVTVTVNPLPTVSFSGLAASYTVNAASATLTGSPVGGTFSGPGISGNTFNPATAGVGGPYSITYSYSNANGCTKTSTLQTNVTVAGGLSTITTGIITPTTFCAGIAVNVPFTTNGAANAGNVFTAQLSNSSGSFTSPVSIGTLSSTASGTIAATIPAGTAAGTGYRIRVVSSAPAVIGSANTSNITVNAGPTASILAAEGETTFCEGTGGVAISGNTTGGTWSVVGGTAGSIFATSGGDYYTTTTNGCGSVQSNHIAVTTTSAGAVEIFTQGSTTFCQGGSVSLISGFPGTWYRNGVQYSFDDNNITVTTSGDYYFIHHGLNGCESDPSNTVTVIVNPLPTVSFSGLAASYTVNAASVTLTGSPAGGTFSGPGISGNTFSPATAGVGGPYSITYAYTNGNGCTNTRIQQTTVTASCAAPGMPGTITATGGNTKVCPGDSKIYSIVAVSGATSYTWTPPPGSVVSSGQGTVSVTITYNAGFVGDSLRIRANNTCGSSNTRALKINRNTPAIPGAITASAGGTKVCAGDSKIYTIVAVSGATSYTWTAPPGSVVSSGQGTVSVTVTYNSGFIGDSLRVTANNSCGNSAARALKINRNTPVMPGAISAPEVGTKVCPGDTKTYSIAAVAGATSYTWTAPPGGVITNGQGTISVTITYNSGFIVGDSLRVRSNNGCGSSAARALKINRNIVPATPGAITGATAGVCNSNDIPYSVTAVAGITYAWSWDVAGASIVSGQGTNAITTNFSGTFVSGKLSVTATNGCGTSTARVLMVYARPATPGAITGSTGVCINQAGVPYSIVAIPNTISYTWYGPTGSHISDQTITSISSNLTTTATNVTVNFGAIAGPVRVKANNACASGGLASLTVSFTCKDGGIQPADITSNENGMLYPNPSNGNFRISLNHIQKLSTVKVEIMNEFGQVLYQSNEKCNDGVISMSLSRKLTDGMYMVRCTVNGVRTVKKLVVSK